MKQIALANMNFHDVNEEFPQLYGPLGGTGRRNTVFFWLLPYIEQGPMYEQAHVSGDYDSRLVAFNPIKTLQCSSDPSYNGGAGLIQPGNLRTVPNSGGQAWAVSSYGANGPAFNRYTVEANPALLDSPGDPSQLMKQTGFAANDQIAIYNGHNLGIVADFRDGTSNTIAFTEKLANCLNPQWGYYYGNSNAWGISSGYPGNRDAWFVDPQDLMPVTMAGWSAMGETNGAPYRLNSPSDWADGGTCNGRKSSSGHTSGLNVSLVDGSVRHVSFNVASRVWWDASTPNNSATGGTNGKNAPSPRHHRSTRGGHVLPAERTVNLWQDYLSG